MGQAQKPRRSAFGASLRNEASCWSLRHAILRNEASIRDRVRFGLRNEAKLLLAANFAQSEQGRQSFVKGALVGSLIAEEEGQLFRIYSLESEALFLKA